MSDIPVTVAVKALQKLYREFTGRDLKADQAKLLLEQIGNGRE